MSDEFGEELSIYVWPKDHVDGEPYGDDFYERLTRALDSEGLAWESV
jgi:hypothetical protein